MPALSASPHAFCDDSMERRVIPKIRLPGAAAALFLAASSLSAPVHADAPVILTPDAIDWRPVGVAGVEVAVVQGDPNAAGPYSMLIKVPAGMKIPPHSHPDAFRTSVVISGVFHFALGDSWDEAALEPYVPGTVWSEPPGANHFAWARDGEVVALLTAIGPTGSTPVAPPQ
jgi:quercetin dioxygenase-like cupin family protein